GRHAAPPAIFLVGEQQMQTITTTTFITSVTTLERIGPEAVERALRDCFFRALLPPSPDDEDGRLYMISSGPAAMLEEVHGPDGQSLCVVTSCNGLCQWLYLPEEKESEALWRGPSPLSDQYQTFRRSGAFDRRAAVDCNVLAATSTVLALVGWPGVAASV